jgi:hypothetical protein
VSDSEPEEVDDTVADHPSELEESEDIAADHTSQAMGESKSAGVLTAEVRVLQVGNGQITRSMYRQLDEAIPERFQPLGRVKDNKRIPKEWGIPKEGMLQLVGRDTKTGALVRYDANPPDWSASDAPEEFTHWLTHTNQSGWYYGVATGPDGRNVIWTRSSTPDGSCPGPFGWHVSKDIPDLPVVQMMGERASYSQGLEENKEKRIGQVLRRIVLAFSYSPPLEANNETPTEQQSSYSQWLEENRAKRCTVDAGLARQGRGRAGRTASGAGQIRRIQSITSDRLARLK